MNANQEARKFALIHLGTDEVYGLEYVAAEVKKCGHHICWFDGNLDTAVADVVAWGTDFLCLSPLTAFFPLSLEFSRSVKALNPAVHTIMGGHHVAAVPEVSELDGIDTAVVGPVYGTIETIVAGRGDKLMRGTPVPVSEMMPARREYFDAIPSIGSRHRKEIISHFGCPYNCSYCSTSRLKAEFSGKEYRKHWLTRRPIDHIIEEARVLMDYPTEEVALEDDDMLYGEEIDEWLPRFTAAWKQEIGLPIFGNVTPNTVVRVSDRTMGTLAELVTVVQMGVQAARRETLKLFNRQFQSEEQVAAAVQRLKKHGIPVKLELIVGAPVEDPIGDALDSVKLAQRVAAGGFATVFPLMLYPGTALHKWCIENDVPMRDDCTFDFYSGVGSVKFPPDIQRKITNITKLGTFFVKYNVDERWMRVLIEMDLTGAAAKAAGEASYYESLRFRLGEKVDEDFAEILAKTNFRY